MPLRLELVPSGRLTGSRHAALLALCSAAYEEDFAPSLRDIGPATHLLGYLGDTLVTHAAWVERALCGGGCGTLWSAYIEAVATDPAHQGNGYGTAVMREIVRHLGAYDLAALSPSDEGFYARLGWETWRGPLSYRHGSRVVPTPEEQVMVFRLNRTPAALSLDAPLECDWRPGEVW
jgi:aminoglycoside 2'-N-acetyltransferase I